MNSIQNLAELLCSTKKIAIISHVNPDGDAVGSSVALTEFLNNCGHSATAILPNSPPRNLLEIEGCDKILIFNKYKEQTIKVIEDAQIIFCLDFNDIETRIDEVGKIVLSNKNCTKILIDHHQAPPKDQYDIMFSNTSKSSTSLMVFEIIENLGKKEQITKPIAEAIFIGMMTDTGNFSYGNLDSELFHTLGFLASKGVVPNALYSRIFNCQRESRIRLMGYALNKKMVILPELKSSYISLTAQELEQFSFIEGDIEGVVNIPLSIEGIENSAIFVEKQSLTKVSLRSLSEGIDVNKFVREYYIGGGHINAAGGKFFGSIENCVEIYVEGLKKIYKSI